MFFSTFLTLVIVPVVYLLLARFSPVHHEVHEDDAVEASPPGEASPTPAG